MEIIKTVCQMQAESERLRLQGKKIGFVPTMGALHEGHLSLIRLAKEKTDVVVLSIFVNPIQFGPHEDLQTYPRDFRRDESLADAEGVDLIFYPSESEMYPPGFLTSVDVEEITDLLCGASRPGHFHGVTTICTKLFHAVHPHIAILGQKDAQQVVVLKRMIKDLNFDLEIIAAPIFREEDGLVMSSRNVYLSPEERRQALALYQSLQFAEELIGKGERNADRIIDSMKALILMKDRISIDYLKAVNAETLQPVPRLEGEILIAIAAFVGKTRLIDNAIVTL